MLNSASIYSSLKFTSGYHHIALSHEAHKKCAFEMPIDNLQFNTVPCGLAQAQHIFDS